MTMTTKNSPDMVKKAEIFATERHAGQLRKDGKTAYINHPANVVRLLHESGICDQNILSAAWLHDVVEDTNTSLQTIHQLFGKDMAEIVDAVTKREDETRMAYLNRVINFGKPAVLIKIADAYNNLQTINGILDEQQRAKTKQRLLDECKKYYLQLAQQLCMPLYERLKMKILE